MKLKYKFIKNIPIAVDDNTLYISCDYRTAIHKCCCGCGNKVITPFSPTDWQLVFNGETISLFPSIGNWSFPCQSHYWIENNTIRFVPRWTKEQIEENREKDALRKAKPYSEKKQINVRPVSHRLWSIFSRWFQK